MSEKYLYLSRNEWILIGLFCFTTAAFLWTSIPNAMVFTVNGLMLMMILGIASEREKFRDD